MTAGLGANVLVLLGALGNCPQETLKTVAVLERSGCVVTFAGPRGNAPAFDAVSTAIAYAEAAWDPTVRLLRRAHRERRFAEIESLHGLAERRALDAWLERFDAVVVPGGHGPGYAAFVRDPVVLDAIATLYRKGRAIGLMCHAPIAAALIDEGGAPLATGRAVTCWPRRYERVLGALPFVGAYLMPFGRPAGEILERAGARVDDVPRLGPGRAVVDGTLVTSRGPWSTAAFASALLRVMAGGTVLPKARAR